jgi:hypothetical protein
MTIVSGGLFQRLRNTKANMNHIMSENTSIANDEQGKSPQSSDVSKTAKTCVIKSI